MDFVLITNLNLTPKLFFNYVIKNKTILAKKKFSAYQCKKLSRKDLIDLELDFLFQSFGSQANYTFYRARAPFLPYYLCIFLKSGLFLSILEPQKTLSLFFRPKQQGVFERMQDLILDKKSLKMLNLLALEDAIQYCLMPYPPIENFAYSLLIKGFDEQQLGSFYFNLDFKALPLYENLSKEEKKAGFLINDYLFPDQGLMSIGADFLKKFYGENVEYFLYKTNKDSLLFFDHFFEFFLGNGGL